MARLVVDNGSLSEMKMRTHRHITALVVDPVTGEFVGAQCPAPSCFCSSRSGRSS